MAGRYGTHAQAFERALVALALGCAVWVEPADDNWHVLVEPPDVTRVRQELGYFDHEQAHWPPHPPVNASTTSGPFLTPLLWAAMIIGVFWLQAANPTLVGFGALDAQALFERGEVWRLLTALFLHADGAHLLSNGLSGIFVFSAVLSVWGNSRGWTLLTAAAVLGNLAAAATYSGVNYRSIGASTAVFAALGLLAAHAMVQLRRMPRSSWRIMVRPLLSAVVVLGLFGAGGQQIDVVAHTTGLIAGLVLGGVVRAWTRKAGPSVQ